MKKHTFSTVWGVRIGISLLACILILVIEWMRPASINRIDEGFRDSFLRLRADLLPENRLVVIDIDEDSLDAIGAWPWPRDRIAELAELLLGSYGAMGVGLDIVFPEAGELQADARLAALAAHAPLTLAQIFDYSSRVPPLRQGMLLGGKVEETKKGIINRTGQQLQVNPYNAVVIPEAIGFIANHTGFAGAHCVGNIGYQPDDDGVLRRLPNSIFFGNHRYVSFSAAILACDGIGMQQLASDNPEVPRRISYRHAAEAFTVVSAHDILTSKVPSGLVSGRYALVGSSSLALGDRVSTPLVPLSAGVMVHAANLVDLLDLAEGKIGHAWSGRPELIVWIVLSLGLATACIARMKAWGGVLVLIVLVVLWTVLAFTGVALQAEWSITAPLWGYFFLLLTAVPYELWITQQRSRRLLTSFSHYVAQPVLDEIIRLDLKHSLEPTLRDVTVLVADMEGYTSLTSLLTLEQAATLTKDFLLCLTRPVLSLGGTLDKYTGDGLVAFWGAPLLCRDQADQAVSAAITILQEVIELNARRKRQGLQTVKVRIGIESGNALVGDLGTAFRSTYTAVGDCINLASRLESAARDLPTQLVIGPATNSLLRQHQTESLGFITFRGGTAAIEVFTVRPDVDSCYRLKILD